MNIPRGFWLLLALLASLSPVAVMAQGDSKSEYEEITGAPYENKLRDLYSTKVEREAQREIIYKNELKEARQKAADKSNLIQTLEGEMQRLSQHAPLPETDSPDTPET